MLNFSVLCLDGSVMEVPSRHCGDFWQKVLAPASTYESLHHTVQLSPVTISVKTHSWLHLLHQQVCKLSPREAISSLPEIASLHNLWKRKYEFAIPSKFDYKMSSPVLTNAQRAHAVYYSQGGSYSGEPFQWFQSSASSGSAAYSETGAFTGDDGSEEAGQSLCSVGATVHGG